MVVAHAADGGGARSGAEPPEVRVRFEGLFPTSNGATALTSVIGGLGVGGPAGVCGGFMLGAATGTPAFYSPEMCALPPKPYHGRKPRCRDQTSRRTCPCQTPPPAAAASRRRREGDEEWARLRGVG